MTAERSTPWLVRGAWLAPAVGLLLLFSAGPALAVAGISVTDWSLGHPGLAFVGLDNYRALFASADFQTSVRNTLVLNAVVVPVSIALALTIALAISGVTRGAAAWQAIYFLPVTANLVAMAVVWDFLLHPELGVVARATVLLGWTPLNWLHDRALVLFAVGLITTWQLVGYYIVLFVAGLTAIPRPLYEAARIDGARTAFDRLVHVTWPMLGPTTLFVGVIAVIKSVQTFDVVKVLTEGGPEKASEILLYTLYQEGFVFFRMGRAAAIATIVLVVMIALTLVQMRAIERRVHYR